ncbi:DUF3311 domain-containing protein [Priestia megaterium]|uniref:DUF3311 domain-containing protein n=1 Tax=Priestia megaterium TaxID=1404 RepID=UPI00272F29DA|nr:DUF3311 domain-containing protein [Priestia megaterium]MDP1442136.1 DUF3311 domain-containing protein [Priestia megaterium]MDP1471087.1 DUF3311 domain-containing protein [Priestia megaterium]
MKPLYFLVVIPVLCFLIGVPLTNRVKPFVLGLPFSMFWIVLCVLLSSVTLWIMYKADQHDEEEVE